MSVRNYNRVIAANGFQLTPREIESLRHMWRGRKVHEIAKRMHIAPQTHSTMMSNARRRNGLRTYQQMLLAVGKSGILGDQK